ncbi:MAG: DUF565 domain-containing protein [Pseudanabaenales cyanobacterium]|nr:DUF565 domain-containing protein [Pseudanabaenales cyanobacterium]
MQRTRLNTLISSTSNRFTRWIFNPWRRLSLIIISLLFGYFFAIVLSSVAGQTADLDVVISAILLLFVELVSWLVYGRQWQRPGDSPVADNSQRSLLLEAANAFKIGLTYALFVEAFKLGS